MSKLKKLIQELCPNGVEYKKLGNICRLSRGKVYSKEYLNNHVGDYPVYSSQTANDGQLGGIDSFDYDGEYLTWTTDGAYAGTIFHRKGKFSITNVCGLISLSSDDILIRFLYYWLSITAKKHVYHGMGNPKLMSNQMGGIEIPIPPLAVQEEIVKMLDRFTEYTAELQAELQARQKQYAFYRNRLLSFDSEFTLNTNEDSCPTTSLMEWKTLREVFDIRNGYTPSKNNSSYWESGTIPWFRMEDIRKNGRILSDSIIHITPIAVKGKGLFEAGSFILATTATIGEHALLIANSLANQQFTNLKIRKSLKDKLLTKFVFYYMFVVDDYCKTHTNKSGFESVDMDALRKMPFPIPPLAEQERIVKILDRFETLVSDLSQGLPAEITAVQEQYEYYRNKLLSFPSNKVSA